MDFFVLIDNYLLFLDTFVDLWTFMDCLLTVYGYSIFMYTFKTFFYEFYGLFSVYGHCGLYNIWLFLDFLLTFIDWIWTFMD